MKKTIFAAFLFLAITSCGGGSGQDADGADASDADISSAAAVLTYVSDASLKYEELRSSLSEDKARLALVDWLNGKDGIADAGLSDDGYTVWFNDASGVNMNVITYSNPYAGLSLKSVMPLKNAILDRKGISNNIDASMPGAQWLYMYVPFLWEQTQACVQEGLFGDVDIDDCSSIDDFPYVDMSGIRDLTKYYIDPSTGLSFYAVPYINDDASIESIASVFTMGMTSEAHIFIHTHGGVTSRNGDKFGFFLTADELSYDNFSERLEDLTSGRLSVASYGGKSYYAITPTFVRKHFADMSLALGIKPNFHVYIAACKSYDAKMIAAFMDSGADSYSGYTGLASHEFVYNSTMSLYSSLSSGMPVNEAVASISPKFDSYNLLTQMMTTTSSDKERYFYRMFLSFNEEDYETPPALKLTVTDDQDGGFSMGGMLTTLPEDDQRTGSPMGTISIKLPSMTEGEHKIDMEQNAVISLVDNSTGKQWIASKECIDDDPLCLCSGSITVEYSDDIPGGVVEGRFNAVLVDKDNVTTTSEISGTFTAVR